MKRSSFGGRASVLRTLALTATLVGVVIAGCTDVPLDMRPTLGAGSSGKAGGMQSGGGTSSTPLTGNGGVDAGDEGGAGGANEGGTRTTGGSAGTGGHSGVTSGSTGGGGGATNNALCGNGMLDAGEECDDGNKLSGDGCSYDCKKNCETCEKDVCPVKALESGTGQGDAYPKAYGIQGDAQQGPKVGTPRVDLLRKFLDCAYQTNCALVTNNTPLKATAQISLRPCGCTIAPAPGASPSVVPQDCQTEDKIMKGPCYNEMKAAAEADSNLEMFSRMSNRNYSLGWAYTLLQFCDAKFCFAECVPDEDVATACPTLTCGTGGTGGSGGTGGTDTGGTSGTAGTDIGGTAGTGGVSTPVCGNGIKEVGEECEPTNTGLCSNDCHSVITDACSKIEAAGACAPLATACTTSPGTATPDTSAACYDVEECVFNTQCAFTPPVTKCFCGQLSLADCGAAPETGQGAPAGACADVIKAGMGAGATNADVVARLNDANYPAGSALKRLACLNLNPTGTCGYLPPCDPPPAPQTGDCIPVNP
jgi:cysteine-rich repeat protein